MDTPPFFWSLLPFSLVSLDAGVLAPPVQIYGKFKIKKKDNNKKLRY